MSTTPADMGERPSALTDAELKLLAQRERWAQDKRDERARKAQERAAEAVAPNPNGYVVPPTPAGLSALRKWLRNGHDAYSRREIGPSELTEMRRTSSSLGDLYRCGAELRKAEAAMRNAMATERIAEALQQVQHGAAAVLLLSRLQEALTDGKRRPLPGRALAAMPTTAEPAE